MNIKFFNKKFEYMKLCEKLATTLLIPAIFAVALGVTLFKLVGGKKKL